MKKVKKTFKVIVKLCDNYSNIDVKIQNTIFTINSVDQQKKKQMLNSLLLWCNSDSILLKFTVRY